MELGPGAVGTPGACPLPSRGRLIAFGTSAGAILPLKGELPAEGWRRGSVCLRQLDPTRLRASLEATLPSRGGIGARSLTRLISPSPTLPPKGEEIALAPSINGVCR
jgi:hypothetical protein